jgi:hypothetical protein
MNMEDLLKEKLNLDTSLIGWHELQRHFASGCVVSVRPGLDLVEAALSVSKDEKEKVEKWILDGKMGKTTDEEARIWHESKAEVWAVVVKPWVLVQEPKPESLQ